MMKKLLLILTFLGTGFLIQAQETMLITKDEVLAKVIQENNTLKNIGAGSNGGQGRLQSIQCHIPAKYKCFAYSYSYHKSVNGFWFKTESGNLDASRF